MGEAGLLAFPALLMALSPVWIWGWRRLAGTRSSRAASRHLCSNYRRQVDRSEAVAERERSDSLLKCPRRKRHFGKPNCTRIWWEQYFRCALCLIAVIIMKLGQKLPAFSEEHSDGVIMAMCIRADVFGIRTARNAFVFDIVSAYSSLRQQACFCLCPMCNSRQRAAIVATLCLS